MARMRKLLGSVGKGKDPSVMVDVWVSTDVLICVATVLVVLTLVTTVDVVTMHLQAEEMTAFPLKLPKHFGLGTYLGGAA